MNYLTICNEVLTETNVTGTALTSVAGQSGVPGRVVRWVNQEYLAICRMEPWSFLYVSDHDFTATIGKRSYNATELGITDLDYWDITKAKSYPVVEGITQEVPLVPIKYAVFQEVLDVGEQSEGPPESIWNYPDSVSVGLDPIPDASYHITLPYWKQAVALSANGSTPVIPEKYHDIIIFKALMRYATWDDAPGLYTSARADYIRLLDEMYDRYLPTIHLAYEPVA
jgi:hypothetical protein